MTLLALTSGPRAYWYLARGTGAVSLLLLTASVVLGILGSERFTRAPWWPRFAVDTVHRDVSLLVIVVLAVHVITSVLDSFAPIRLTDAVIPFITSYRPLWLGLGALAFDFMLAIVITSLVRRRLGLTAWRTVHWLAYASWPIAVLHGLGTGSDTKQGWMLLLTAICGAAVAVAILARVGRSAPERWRLPFAGATGVAAVGIVAFTMLGPLQRGWARRAGTPAVLLGATSGRAAARTSMPRRGSLAVPFTAHVSGSVNQSQTPGGAIVDIALRMSGGAHGQLRVRVAGSPIGGGGLSMTGSQVDLLADGLPVVMQGRITSLQGQQFDARVTAPGQRALTLHANLNIDGSTGQVTGTVEASAA